MENKQNLEEKYGLFTAISMVIGQVIGSGIFFKVDDILVATQGNILAGLIGWLVVGFSVIFGAISMAYYAQLIPKDGGILKYVEYRFGHHASYFVGWIYMMLFYPILTAVLFTVSGIYIANFLAEFMDFTPQFLHYSLIGLFNLLLFFGINVFRPKAVGVFQSITTVIKIIPLILIAGIGIVSLVSGDVTKAHTFSYAAQSVPKNTSLFMLAMASFIPIAFAFDGWYIVTQISGEIKNSKKNLPIALVFGTIAVLLIYVFYYSGIALRMGSEEVIALKDTYITEFSRKIGSHVGAIAIQVFIIISVLGTSNGLLMAAIRLPYQFSNLEKTQSTFNFGEVHPRWKMPIKSAFLGLFLTIISLYLFYLTNVDEYFTSSHFDISAVPITFIYVVNGLLFLGLFKLIKNKTIKGNSFIKYLFISIAIIGICIVLYGAITGENGLTYISITLVTLLVGFLFKKKD